MQEENVNRKLQAAIDAYLKEQNDIALSLCREVLTDAPQRADAWTLQGMLYRRDKKWERAKESYQRAISLDPSYGDAYNNLANVFRELGYFDEAVKNSLKALELRSDWADVHNSLAAIYQAKGDLENAFKHFEKALELNPNNPDYHWDHSLCLLLAGRYKEGWDEYEWRWKRGQPAPRGFSQPEWKGEALAGKRLLVYGEQGFGDAIQFMRFVPMLKAYGGIIILEILESLHGLVANSLEVDEIVATGTSLPEFDCHIPLISLARMFAGSVDKLPQDIPYLEASDERIDYWQPRLAARTLKVGLVWAGNPNVKNDHWRSPRLSPLVPLLDTPNVTFYALQKGDGRDDLKKCVMPSNFIDLGDDIRDFADTAAILSQLDLLITTDTSVAHLAGAIGCKTWLMLHAAPDWRWLLDRRDSPWYPSFRLYRQSILGRWDLVVDEIKHDLSHWAGPQADSVEQTWGSNAKPVFSIIIPYYEGSVPAYYLTRCLESLKNQTYQNFEIILIHDGEKVRPWSLDVELDRYPQISYLGESEARFADWGHSLRDIGIKKARGEYLIHLNADNLLYPIALEKMVEEMKKVRKGIGNSAIDINSNDILIFPILLVGVQADGSQHWQESRNNPEHSMLLTGYPSIPHYIDCMQLVMRRKLWLEYGGWYDKTVNSDGTMYHRFVKERGAKYVPEVLGEHW